MDIAALQTALAARGFASGAIDGAWGPKTRAAVMAALQGNPARLTPADIVTAADAWGLEPAKVGAVYDVESRGTGFDPSTRRPIILYEPHIFHRQTGGRFTGRSPVSYASWGESPYPRLQSERYDQLMTAVGLDPDAGFASASWGLFQIMGFNFKAAGFASPFEFALGMADGEFAQLQAFGSFIRSTGLLAKLKACTADPETCRPFCKGYNGSGYATHGYHVKLAAAIKRRSR